MLKRDLKTIKTTNINDQKSYAIQTLTKSEERKVEVKSNEIEKEITKGIRNYKIKNAVDKVDFKVDHKVKQHTVHIVEELTKTNELYRPYSRMNDFHYLCGVLCLSLRTETPFASHFKSKTPRESSSNLSPPSFRSTLSESNTQENQNQNHK